MGFGFILVNHTPDQPLRQAIPFPTNYIVSPFGQNQHVMGKEQRVLGMC
jgi:hypothetical protein